MKIAVVGGGSTYTPELVLGVACDADIRTCGLRPCVRLRRRPTTYESKEDA
jgi:hypothetical protein